MGRLSNRKLERQKEKAKQLFLHDWESYGRLSDALPDWFTQYSRSEYYPRMQPIPAGHAGASAPLLWVAEGLLARVVITSKNKRTILAFITPGMACLQQFNIRSNTPLPGDLVALRPTTVLRIPRHVLDQAKEQDAGLATFYQALREKELKQYIHRHTIMCEDRPDVRYCIFQQLLPHIRRSTTYQEQADYIQVSLSSVKRAIKNG